MKITNQTLLHAMKYADETLIETTAPHNDTDEKEETKMMTADHVTRKQKIVRRVIEIGALCAAVAFCVLAGYGISRLHTGELPAVTPAVSTTDTNKTDTGTTDTGTMDTSKSEDAKAARKIVEEYTKALLKNDREKVLSVSLIERMAKLDGDTFSPDAWLPDADNLPTDIELPDKDYDAEQNGYIQELVNNEQDIADYYYLSLLKKGKTDLAEKFNPETDEYLAFFKSFERFYSFPVTMIYEDDDQSDGAIAAVRIDGKWYVMPDGILTPVLSDEAQAKLPQLRKEFEELGKEKFIGSEYSGSTKAEQSENAKAARKVVEEFTNAVLKHDQKKALSLTKIDYTRQGFLPDGDVLKTIELPDEDYNADQNAQIQKIITEEKDSAEYRYLLLLKQGKTELAEQNNPEKNDSQTFFQTIECYYSFPVNYIRKDNTSYADKIDAVRIDGTWYALPTGLLIPNMTEAEREELPKLRAELEDLGMEDFIGSGKTEETTAPFTQNSVCPLPDFSADRMLTTDEEGNGYLERSATDVKALSDILKSAQWEKLDKDASLSDYISDDDDGSQVFVLHDGKCIEMILWSSGVVIFIPEWNAYPLNYENYRISQQDMETAFRIADSRNVYGWKEKVINYDWQTDLEYPNPFECLDRYKNSCEPPVWFSESPVVRFANAAYAPPYLLEPDQESVDDICNQMNHALWQKAEPDAKIRDGERFTLYCWNSGNPFAMTFCPSSNEMDYPVIIQRNGTEEVYYVSRGIYLFAQDLSMGEDFDDLPNHLVNTNQDIITPENAWADKRT